MEEGSKRDSSAKSSKRNIDTKRSLELILAGFIIMHTPSEEEIAEIAEHRVEID